MNKSSSLRWVLLSVALCASLGAVPASAHQGRDHAGPPPPAYPPPPAPYHGPPRPVVVVVRPYRRAAYPYCGRPYYGPRYPLARLGGLVILHDVLH